MNTLYVPSLYSNGYWLMLSDEDRDVGIIVAPNGEEVKIKRIWEQGEDIHTFTVYVSKSGRDYTPTSYELLEEFFASLVRTRIVGGSFSEDVVDEMAGRWQNGYEEGYKKGKQDGYAEGFDEGYEEAKDDILETIARNS